MIRLPPTTESLNRPDGRPYFLWWLDCTVEEFRDKLRDPSPETRAYYYGALLREANTRDVWLFVTPGQIRELWHLIERHLGKSRAMWAWLLDIDRTAIERSP
jgi:hypothetical protein